MRKLMMVLASVLVLNGCAGLGVGLPTTPGAFIVAPKGKLFEPIDTLDPRNAMIYIYRPANQWGNEELQAPIFFMDGTQLFGLKSGAYTWLEVNAGSYEFYARRPFSILYLDTIFDLKLDVQGGRDYYFRYSELRPLDMDELVANPEDYYQDGPLQQVPLEVARREIAKLRLDAPGVYYAEIGERNPRWAPFYTYPDSRGVEHDFRPGWWTRTRNSVGDWFSRMRLLM